VVVVGFRSAGSRREFQWEAADESAVTEGRTGKTDNCRVFAMGKKREGKGINERKWTNT
jgi:hypothetical protein